MLPSAALVVTGYALAIERGTVPVMLPVPFVAVEVVLLAMAGCVLWALFVVRYSAGVRADWLRAREAGTLPRA